MIAQEHESQAHSVPDGLYTAPFSELHSEAVYLLTLGYQC